jgi:hypothetical protein
LVALAILSIEVEPAIETVPESSTGFVAGGSSAVVVSVVAGAGASAVVTVSAGVGAGVAVGVWASEVQAANIVADMAKVKIKASVFFFIIWFFLLVVRQLVCAAGV